MNLEEMTLMELYTLKREIEEELERRFREAEGRPGLG